MATNKKSAKKLKGAFPHEQLPDAPAAPRKAYLHFPDETAVVQILEVLLPFSKQARGLILDTVAANITFYPDCLVTGAVWPAGLRPVTRPVVQGGGTDTASDESDPWDGAIGSFLHHEANGETSIAELLTNCLRIKPEDYTQAAANRVAAILRARGWRKFRSGGLTRTSVYRQYNPGGRA